MTKDKKTNLLKGAMFAALYQLQLLFLHQQRKSALLLAILH